METLEVLLAMREQLKGGWVKEKLVHCLPMTYFGEENPLVLGVCLQGACVAAVDAKLLWAPATELAVFLGSVASVAEVLVKVIDEQFPGRTVNGPAWVKVVWFNDDEDTSIEDVRMVVDKAITSCGG